MACTPGRLGTLFTNGKDWYLDSNCSIPALDVDYTTDEELDTLNTERWNAYREQQNRRRRNVLYFLIGTALIAGYFLFIYKKS